MPNFDHKPVTTTVGSTTTVVLRLNDGTADGVWRNLFNEQAADERVDAEAMGSKVADLERTVLTVRFGEEATAADVKARLEKVKEIADRVDATTIDRHEKNNRLGYAAIEWWAGVNKRL